MEDDGPRPPIFTAHRDAFTTPDDAERLEDDPQRRLGRAIWWGLTALGLHGAQWASLLAGALLTAYAISRVDSYAAVLCASAYMLLVNVPLWLTRPRK